ncbi:hypothetical protein OK074_5368 [Actinobacteria bacterium OK074]|nr:hypothetical protein OK074_5368 [Actinobacteria bacterium OK074]
MSDHGFLESTKQFALCLAELQSSLDAESYELLLRILKGTNEAFVRRNTDIDINLSPREQELFTPEFGERLSQLLSLLGPLGAHTSVDLGSLTGAGAHAGGGAAESENGNGSEAVRDHERERDRVRREVEAIARASGLKP